jgi:hypothetical protein
MAPPLDLRANGCQYPPDLCTVSNSDCKSLCFSTYEQVAGGLWSHTEEGRTDDLASAQIVTDGSVNGQPMRSCQVAEGIKKHKFGEGLTEVEKKWVTSELATFLKSVNPSYRWVIKLNNAVFVYTNKGFMIRRVLLQYPMLEARCHDGPTLCTCLKTR